MQEKEEKIKGAIQSTSFEKNTWAARCVSAYEKKNSPETMISKVCSSCCSANDVALWIRFFSFGFRFRMICRGFKNPRGVFGKRENTKKKPGKLYQIARASGPLVSRKVHKYRTWAKIIMRLRCPKLEFVGLLNARARLCRGTKKKHLRKKKNTPGEIVGNRDDFLNEWKRLALFCHLYVCTFYFIRWRFFFLRSLQWSCLRMNFVKLVGVICYTGFPA